MNIRHISGIILSLTLILTGCSRNSTPVSRTTKSTDLGTVEVSNGKEMQYALGDDQQCSIKSTVSTNGTIVLDMKVERSGKLLSRPRIQTTSGVPVSFSANDVNFSLTPIIKQ